MESTIYTIYTKWNQQKKFSLQKPEKKPLEKIKKKKNYRRGPLFSQI